MVFQFDTAMTVIVSDPKTEAPMHPSRGGVAF
jgi:hypothetical protein